MTNYLARALQHIGADEGDVLAHRLDEKAGEYVLVLDYGIKGCPKYRVPLAALPELEGTPDPAPEPEPEPEMYVCDGCGREFDSERGLAMHQSRWCEALQDEEE